MIQFNLLPDIKLKYIKAQHQKQLITSISVLATAVAIVILVLLFLFVDVVQKKNLHDLSADIKTDSSKLTGTKDINKILTVQNQLNSLPALNDKKPVTSRLYGYLTSLTPSTAAISNLTADFSQNTLSITGLADNLVTVNTYVDTLKFTTYTTDSTTTAVPAFTNVVLASFTRDTKNATYTITLNFDPLIFSGNSTNVKLNVPKIITTRSEVDKPTDLFQTTNTVTR